MGTSGGMSLALGVSSKLKSLNQHRMVDCGDTSDAVWLQQSEPG